MKNVEFQEEATGLKNDSAFLNACREAIERISEKAPSDHSVKILVGREDGRYRIRVRLRSAVLKFVQQSAAMSPFMALDAAVNEAFYRVTKWSLSRAS